MRNPLNAEEREAWARLSATVTPLDGTQMLLPRAAVRPVAQPVATPRTQSPAAPPSTRRPHPHTPADTLDGGWDRRLRRGSVAPDRMIDLHGHTVLEARAALERALDDAVVGGARLLLVITGKPPRGTDVRRGQIRAAIFDWLAQSRHAPAIAAVRNAHPRHGGAGALYLILRRKRGG